MKEPDVLRLLDLIHKAIDRENRFAEGHLAKGERGKYRACLSTMTVLRRILREYE